MPVPEAQSPLARRLLRNPPRGARLEFLENRFPTRAQADGLPFPVISRIVGQQWADNPFAISRHVRQLGIVSEELGRAVQIIRGGAG